MSDIRDYEAMAMLDLQESERGLIRASLDGLCEEFSVLESIDTEGIEPLVTVLDICNVMREDCAVKLFAREEILANAPEQCDGYFLVPGTIH